MAESDAAPVNWGSHGRARPRFSVITVCRNARAHIGAALATLAAQTFRDFEHVIVDGASTDGTLEVVSAAALPNAHVMSGRDGGIFDAMNRGIEHSIGEYLYFLNADDRLLDPTVLDRINRAITLNREPDLLWGDVIYVDESRSTLWRFGHLTPQNLGFLDLNHQAVFARRTLFRDFGRFDTGLALNADYEWLLRVFRGEASRAHVPLAVAFFRCGGAHQRQRVRMVIERFTVRRRHLGLRELVMGIGPSRVAHRMLRHERQVPLRSPSVCAPETVE